MAFILEELSHVFKRGNRLRPIFFEVAIEFSLDLVSKEFNHLAAILHVYVGGLNFMK